MADFNALGYSDVRELETGEIAGLQRMAFTTGLIVGLNDTGYRCRYCYPDIAGARAALNIWNGSGDPPGNWIKQKGLGIDRPNTAFRGIRIATA